MIKFSLSELLDSEIGFDIEERLAKNDEDRYVQEGDVEDVLTALYELGYVVTKPVLD